MKPEGKDKAHKDEARHAQVHGADREVPVLRGVKKGNPDDSSKRKHEAQAIRDNVNHGRDSAFGIVAVQNVEAALQP